MRGGKRALSRAPQAAPTLALALSLALGIVIFGCEQETVGGDAVTQKAPAEKKREHMESRGQKPYVNPMLGITFPIQAHLYPVWFEKEGGGFLYFVEEADRAGATDVPGAGRVAKIRGEVFPTPSRQEKMSWKKSEGLVPYALEQRLQQEGGEGEWQLLVPAGDYTLQLVVDTKDRAMLEAIAEGLQENE